MNAPSPWGKTAQSSAFGLHGAQFIVDAEKRLVVLQLGKRITSGDLQEYASLLRADPAFQPNFSEIVDMRNVEKVMLDADDMMKLADTVDPFSYESYRAFVVQTATQAHAARMHKILRTQRNFEIFRSLEEAERWIAEPVSQSNEPLQ